MTETFKLLWSISCYLFFLYFFYSQTQEYLLRKTTSSCGIVQWLRPPAISICAPLEDLYCNELNHSNHIDCRKELYSHPTDVIFSKVPSVLNIISSVKLLNENDDKVDGFRTVEFMMNGQKCVQLRPAVSYFPFEYAFIQINSSISLRFHLNSINQLPYGLNSHVFYQNPIVKNKLQAVQLVQVASTGIPAPYDTNCRDYGKWSFQNQDHCLQQCIASTSRPSFPIEFLVNGSDSNIRYERGVLNSSFSRCFDKCSKVDCLQESFTLLSSVPFPLNGQNINVGFKFGIMLKIDKFKVNIQYEPAISFETYFTYIGGLICLWLGFSALSFSSVMNFLVRQMPRKYISIFYCKICLFMFCAIGCTWQVVNISQVYFHYALGSELYSGISIDMQTQAVSVCFHLTDILNFNDSSVELCGKTLVTYDRHRCLNEFNNRSYAEIDDMTLNPNQLFTSFTTFHDDFDKTYRSEDFPRLSDNILTRFFKNGRKCFRFQSERDLIPTGTIMRINRTKNVIFDTAPTITLHKKNTFTRSNGDLYARMPLIAKGHVVVSNLLIMNQLQYKNPRRCVLNIPPAPSTADKLEECIYQLAENNIPFDYISVITKEYFNITYSNEPTINLSHIHSVCSKRNRVVDCFQRYYDVRTLGDSTVLERILIKSPKQVTLHQDFVKLTLIEYLLYVSSLLGMWFDFTLFIAFVSADRIRLGRLTKSQKAAYRQSGTDVRRVVRRKHRQRRKQFRILRYISKACILCVLKVILIYQLIDICELYFSRQMITRTSMVKPEYIEMPAMSVCYLLCYNLIYNQSMQGLPCFYEMFLKYSTKDWDSKTLNFTDLVGVIGVRDPNTYKLNFHNPISKYQSFQPDEYYIDEFKCFTFNNLLHGELFNSKRLEYNMIPMTMIEYQFKRKGIYYFYMHQPNSYVRYSNLREMFVSGRITNNIYQYTITSATLLQYPYATNCYHYKESREACYETCVQRICNQQYNKSALPFVRMKNSTYSGAFRDESFPKPITRACRKACSKPDCKMQIITYKNKNLNAMDMHSDYGLKVDGCRFHTHSEYLSKLNLIDFIFYLGGLFGLWLGLNFISLHELILWSVKKVNLTCNTQ